MISVRIYAALSLIVCLYVWISLSAWAWFATVPSVSIYIRLRDVLVANRRATADESNTTLLDHSLYGLGRLGWDTGWLAGLVDDGDDDDDVCGHLVSDGVLYCRQQTASNRPTEPPVEPLALWIEMTGKRYSNIVPVPSDTIMSMAVVCILSHFTYSVNFGYKGRGYKRLSHKNDILPCHSNRNRSKFLRL